MRRIAKAAFIGRQAELDALREALEGAVSGRGGLFLVVGEAGIGKTRLLDELGGDAARRGVEVIWGRCREGEGAPPYWPWIQAIRSCLASSEPGSSAMQAGPGPAYIAQIVPEIRVRFADLPATPTSGESQYARFYLFDAVTTFFRSASLAKPILLLFDDLQWADVSSLLLLRFFAHEVHSARLLVVATYRDTELGRLPHVARELADLGREGGHLSLRGLSEEEVAIFIEQASGRPPSAALARRLHRETEGNPFFVDEIVRLLGLEGLLEGPAATALPVPHGVRHAIRRRLDPLDGECRDLLRTAAVIGRAFELAALRRLSGRDAESLLELLGEAIGHGIVDADPSARGRYRFSHALVRETLYDEHSPATRTGLHRRIGEALEEIHREDPDPPLTELAHHFLEAAPPGQPEKAIDYATRAGRRAAAALAYEEAAELYRRALAALELAPERDGRLRCDLLRALGAVLWKAADEPGAREAFRMAADVARSVDDPVRVAESALGLAGEGSGRLWLQSGIVDEAVVDRIEEALRLLGGRDDRLRAQLLAWLAVQLHYSRSPERSTALTEEAVTLARGVGDPRVLVGVLRARSVALGAVEYADQRLAAAAEIVEIA
ncbi:MAG: ATP-binding protein, partial [Candidatus Binatia bacterium]